MKEIWKKNEDPLYNLELHNMIFSPTSANRPHIWH